MAIGDQIDGRSINVPGTAPAVRKYDDKEAGI